MPRPRKCRKVCSFPHNPGFIPLNQRGAAEPVILAVDEYEAIRLIDREGYSQEQCGAYMAVSRATVQQIYTLARKKLADALVEGRPLRIEGGDYRICEGDEQYCGCHGCGQCSWVRQPIGGSQMKIAIPLDENEKDVCVSFGRAPLYLFWEDGNTQILPNPAADAEGGAGIKAAQFLVDQAATALITVRCGQNAANVFQAAGMKIYEAKKGCTAAENLALLSDNQLEELTHFHAGYHGIR